MCGIFGFSVLNDNTRALAPILAYAMEERGNDSWGMSNGKQIYKYPNSIVENFWLPDDWEGQPVIVHTRAASVGDVSEENAHPFHFTRDDNGDWITGIHNGHINSHSDMAKKYDRKFSVDSMHIFRHILDELPLSEIRGWGAIAYFQGSRGENKINLVRFNMDALHVFPLLTGEYVFCSTHKPIINGGGIVGLTVCDEQKLTSDWHYQLVLKDTGASEFVSIGSMVFGGRYVSNAGFQSTDTRSNKGCYPNNHAFGYGSSSFSPNEKETPDNYFDRWRKLNRCACCKMEKVDRSKKLVCQACEAEAYDEYIFCKESYLYLLGGNRYSPLVFENAEVA